MIAEHDLVCARCMLSERVTFLTFLSGHDDGEWWVAKPSSPRPVVRAGIVSRQVLGVFFAHVGGYLAAHAPAGTVRTPGAEAAAPVFVHHSADGDLIIKARHPTCPRLQGSLSRF